MIINNSSDHIYLIDNGKIYVIKKHSLNEKVIETIERTNKPRITKTNAPNIVVENYADDEHYIISYINSPMSVMDKEQIKQSHDKSLFIFLDYRWLHFLKTKRPTWQKYYNSTKMELKNYDTRIILQNYICEMTDERIYICDIVNRKFICDIHFESFFGNYYSKFYSEFLVCKCTILKGHDYFHYRDRHGIYHYKIYEIDKNIISFVTNKSAFVIDIFTKEVLLCYDYVNYEYTKMLLYVYPINIKHKYLVIGYDNTSKILVPFHIYTGFMKIKDYKDVGFSFQ